MSKKLYSASNIILALIGLIFLFELIRDSNNAGDFNGYVEAGRAVLSGTNIYNDPYNTWPPLFSIFSVPLALGDNVSSYLLRLSWLIGSLAAFYFTIVISLKLVFNKTLTFGKEDNGIMIQDAIVLVPLLIMLRYIMENLANIQINMYMLFSTMLAIYCFTKKKYTWAGILLAFTISLKVYTIFFLFYFLFKREFKVVGWTVVFLLILNIVPIFIWGFDQSLAYYDQFINDVAQRSYIARHKNQSLFGMFLRIFTSETTGFSLSINLFDLTAHTTKLLTYGAVCLTAIIPAFLFRKKLSNTSNIKSIIEYSIVFTVIPILSPISWKAYFIFLWVPYFLLFAILFRTDTTLSSRTIKWLKIFFWTSVALIVFSSEIFVGFDFSDVLEVYSVITIGTIILIALQLYVFIHIDYFDFNSTKFMKRPQKQIDNENTNQISR